MMNCKSCGKDITNDECKKVADWAFCLKCFQKLMDKPKKESKKQKETLPNGESDQVAPVQEKVHCQVCQRALEPGQSKKLGIWDFCPDCYADFTVMPKKIPFSEKGDIEEADTVDTEETEGRVQVKIDFSTFVNCRSCGRRILEKGSKMVDDEPFCPDCFFRLRKKQEQSNNIPSQKPAEPSDSRLTTNISLNVTEAGAESVCESCGREVPRKSLKKFEGFTICQACLSSDPQLAVQIAKEKYRKYMQQLKEKLGSKET